MHSIAQRTGRWRECIEELQAQVARQRDTLALCRSPRDRPSHTNSAGCCGKKSETSLFGWCRRNATRRRRRRESASGRRTKAVQSWIRRTRAVDDKMSRPRKFDHGRRRDHHQRSTSENDRHLDRKAREDRLRAMRPRHRNLTFRCRSREGALGRRFLRLVAATTIDPLGHRARRRRCLLTDRVRQLLHRGAEERRAGTRDRARAQARRE
jgi:hypothetical protein